MGVRHLPAAGGRAARAPLMAERATAFPRERTNHGTRLAARDVAYRHPASRWTWRFGKRKGRLGSGRPVPPFRPARFGIGLLLRSIHDGRRSASTGGGYTDGPS